MKNIRTANSKSRLRKLSAAATTFYLTEPKRWVNNWNGQLNWISHDGLNNRYRLVKYCPRVPPRQMKTAFCFGTGREEYL
jgi:hypothetical protein